MTITEALEKILGSRYGRDVRQAIHDGIKQAYEDAISSGHADMEVSQARGTYDTLAERLDETTAQLAQKATKGDIGLDDLNKNKLQFDETWFSDDVKQQWAGNTPIHTTPEDESITTKKLANKAVTATKLVGAELRPVSVNLFNKDDILSGGFYTRETGQWTPAVWYSTSNFIRVEPNVMYRTSHKRNVVFWDKDKNFISGKYSDIYTTPRNTAYITQQFEDVTQDEFMVTKESDWPDSYVPFEEGVSIGKKWDISDAVFNIKDNSILGTKLDDVRKISTTVNLYNKDDILLSGFFEYTQDGTWVSSGQFDSSNFIPVQPNIRYRKGNNRSYCLWDEHFNFITGNNWTNTFQTTTDTAYVTFAIEKDLVETMMFTLEDDWPDSFIPYKGGYELGESWIMPEGKGSQSVLKDVYLRVPTPYHDGSNDSWATHQTTHPSIVQFDDGWNGWKYWMAHTPYPHSHSGLENPCIAVSQNGIKWEEPEGISNPLVEAPTGSGYNSDAHMFYNDVSKKMEIWYREVLGVGVGDEENIYRIISSDGINWGTPELMIHSSASNVLQLISPSVIFDDGVYKMWVMRDRYIVYMTSTNGKDWTDPVDVLSNGSKISTWHPNVVLHDNRLHLLNLITPGTINYSYSSLGNETSFTEEKTILQYSGNEWDVTGQGLYRASPIFKDRSIILLHGTRSQQNDWLIGAASGLDFYNLKPITQKALDFYGVE